MRRLSPAYLGILRRCARNIGESKRQNRNDSNQGTVPETLRRIKSLKPSVSLPVLPLRAFLELIWDAVPRSSIIFGLTAAYGRRYGWLEHGITSKSLSGSLSAYSLA